LGPDVRGQKQHEHHQLGHQATHALDARQVAPDHYAILLENSKVRVLDTWVEHGQRTPIRAHE